MADHPTGESEFRVRPTKQARREDIFKTAEEKLWVLSQLRQLRHWPLDKNKQERFGSDLDFSKVHYRDETFYELRLDDQNFAQKEPSGFLLNFREE